MQSLFLILLTFLSVSCQAIDFSDSSTDFDDICWVILSNQKEAVIEIADIYYSTNRQWSNMLRYNYLLGRIQAYQDALHILQPSKWAPTLDEGDFLLVPSHMHHLSLVN